MRGTLFANLRISTGLSAGILPPKIRPTSTWYGLPWVTAGARVRVEMNLESIVLDNPFLISISSIGERQLVGGFNNFTGFPFIIRSPWNASRSARIWSAFIDFGFVFSSIPAAKHNSLLARADTPEKFILRKTVNLESVDSEAIRWSCPNSMPWGWGLMPSTLVGSRSVTRGQW